MQKSCAPAPPSIKDFFLDRVCIVDIPSEELSLEQKVFISQKLSRQYLCKHILKSRSSGGPEQFSSSPSCVSSSSQSTLKKIFYAV